MAREDLGVAQARMKAHYDRKAKMSTFETGQEVLALLPLQGKPLAAKSSGPCVVKMVEETDCFIAAPVSRTDVQLCHVMSNPYYR